MEHSVRLKEGKGAFVRRALANGGVENVCECIWNADFSFRGCIAQVHGDYLNEVLRNGGQYDAGTIPAKWALKGVDHTCDYCYAYGNWGKVGSRVVDDMTRRDFEQSKPEYVRLGKDTECGHDSYIPALMDFLDLCKEFGSKVIFPTKMLGYRHDVAQKLAENGGVVHRSIGGDRYESGAVSQGYTNSWRVEQARLDSLAGVNEDLTIVCDVTRSILDNQKSGFYVAEALKASEEFGIPVRFIPLRLNAERLARKVTGQSMQGLRDTNTPLPGYEVPLRGLWRTRGNNELAPNSLHPDFQRLYDEGIGICGEVGDLEYCDKCNLSPGKPIRIVFPLSQKPKVVYDRKVGAKGRWGWKNREKIRAQRAQDKLQGKLDLAI